MTDVIDADGNIRVVMYYYPTGGPSTSPVNIFDCHICGQKFRVFPRIEQHYLKKHGCVVVKCGEGAEPRISCPFLPMTKVTTATAVASASKAEPSPASAATAAALAGGAAGKRKKGDQRQRQRQTAIKHGHSQNQNQSILNFLTPKPKPEAEPEPPSKRKQEPEPPEPVIIAIHDDSEDDGDEVPAAVAATASALVPAPVPENENEEPTDATNENNPKPKPAASKRRRRRPRWSRARPQAKPRASKTIEVASENTTGLEADSFSAASALATPLTPLDSSVTDWEVKLDSPAPGKLKLKKGKAELNAGRESRDSGHTGGITPARGPTSQPPPSTPSFPRTPFSVLINNASTPAPRNPRIVIVTSSTSSSSSSSSSSPSASSNSRSTSAQARDSRYARRLAAREANTAAAATTASKVPATAPRRLELTDFEIKTDTEPQATRADEPKSEDANLPMDSKAETSETTAQAQNERGNKPEIVANANSSETEAEATTPETPETDAAECPEIDLNSENSRTEPKANENFTASEPNESTKAGGGQDSSNFNEVCLGGEGTATLTLTPDIDAELLEFLARETGFGRPSLGFTDTASLSADFELSDILYFLEENSSAPAADASVHENSDMEPTAVAVTSEEEGSKLVAAEELCNSSSPKPKLQYQDIQNAHASGHDQVMSPDTEHRKRKLFDSMRQAAAAASSADFMLPTPSKKARLLPAAEAEVEIHSVVDGVDANDDGEDHEDKENQSLYYQNTEFQAADQGYKQEDRACGLGEDSFHSAQDLDSLPLKLRLCAANPGL